MPTGATPQVRFPEEVARLAVEFLLRREYSPKVVQHAYTETGAFASSALTIPLDNTIPQNTEGVQVMTVGITPQSVANILAIEVVVFAGVSGGVALCVALFQDATANALAAAAIMGPQNPGTLSFNHIMLAGTTSPTVFKVRAGGSSASTIYINGSATTGLGFFGGVAATSLRVTEFMP